MRYSDRYFRISDLKNVEILHVENQDFLRIGSALNFNQIIKHNEIQLRFPLLSKVLFESSDPARRNGYTLGGRLALKKARGMILPALIVMDAVIVTQDEKGEHFHSCVDWLDKNFKPENVLIKAIILPVPQRPLWVVKDAKRRESPGEQIVGVIVAADQTSENLISNIKISSTVDKSGLVSFTGIETILDGRPPSEKLFDLVSELIFNPQKINWRMSEEDQYRAQIMAALLKRCLRELFLEEQKEQK